MQMPIRFRKKGDLEWQEGTTICVSKSGVVFRANRLLQPKTPVEMVLTLPALAGSNAAARIVCGGTVVRFKASANGNGAPIMVAAIRHSRVSREKSVERIAWSD